MWGRIGVVAAVLPLLFGCGIRQMRAAGASSGPGAFSNYQAPRRPESAYIGLLHTSIWRPLNGTGPWPLVIFSHGYGGSSTQSKFLMTALADDGYLVVAPDHKDAFLGIRRDEDHQFLKPDEWTDQRYKDRAEDIQKLIASLKSDPAWKGKIDWSRVALAGHSLGGYTVLGLAGGWPSWKIPGIKAVLAMSPYASPLVEAGHLESIDVPVMYQGGTRDFGITPFVSRSGGAFDKTPSPAYFVDFEGAGHLAWTDLQPNYQREIDVYAMAFLDRYVKGEANANLAQRMAGVSELRSK